MVINSIILSKKDSKLKDKLIFKKKREEQLFIIANYLSFGFLK